MDFDQIKTLALDHLRRPGDTVLATKIGDFVNTAQYQLCLAHKFHFLRTTIPLSLVAGTYQYAITTREVIGIRRIAYVGSDGKEKITSLTRLKDERPLGVVFQGQTADMPLYWDYAFQSSASAPSHNKIEIAPTPNATAALGSLNVHCIAHLAPLVQGGDTNPLTTQIPMALVYTAVAYGKAYLEEMDKVVDFLTMAQNQVNDFARESRRKFLDDDFDFTTGIFEESTIAHYDFYEPYSWT